MNNKLKICMYVQTSDLRNPSSYKTMLNTVKKNKIDLLVFPETCYTPFVKKMESRLNYDDDSFDEIGNCCLELSKEIKAAVIVGVQDINGIIYNIYANAYASGEETEFCVYIKHTMTRASAFDFDNYSDDIMQNFPIITLKDIYLGMTICYDCNHAIFSNMYYGVDAIINSTGGDVTRDKWYKYNKARAIENACFNIVTMGGDKEHYCGTFGFNSEGGEIDCKQIGDGLYIYEVDKDLECEPTDDENCFPNETLNKYQDFFIPVKAYSDFIAKGKAKEIRDGLYVMPHFYEHDCKKINSNIVFIVADGDDIVTPEYILPRMYDKKLKKIDNKRYIIINKSSGMTEDGFKKYISVILKVRAMENYCAVILESDYTNKCYQTSMNRVTQVVAAENGMYGIDLSRTTGPEAIWKNKLGMQASWRTGYEALVKFSEERYLEAMQED